MMVTLAVSAVVATILTDCEVMLCINMYNCGVKISNIEHNYVRRERWEYRCAATRPDRTRDSW
jgi:hypothetical protein